MPVLLFQNQPIRLHNEIQKAAEEKMNTITLQDIIDTYYQRISIENNLQNII